jgi:hypothetical protein
MMAFVPAIAFVTNRMRTFVHFAPDAISESNSSYLRGFKDGHVCGSGKWS